MTIYTSIGFMIVATILVAIWINLQRSSIDDDILITSAAKIIKLKNKIYNEKSKMISQGIHVQKNSIKTKRKKEKHINKLEQKLRQIQRDKYASTNPISYSGLQLIRLFKIDTTNRYYRKLHKAVNEIYGPVNSSVLTKNLFAEGVSYLIIGLSLILVLAVYIMETGQPQKGFLVGIVGVLVVFIAVYMIYDDIFYKVKKRRAELLLDFPQVITKIALLVNAGIELTEAWRLTAFSAHKLIYFEMQSVCMALDNGISLRVAFKDFIDRCNVKDIAMLGVAIEQAHIKGNKEIAKSLMSLSENVWEERKYRARRMGELANSKLLIPIIMIFGGIMMMVIVPLITNLGI